MMVTTVSLLLDLVLLGLLVYFFVMGVRRGLILCAPCWQFSWPCWVDGIWLPTGPNPWRTDWNRSFWNPS